MLILFIDDQESRHMVVESVLGKEHKVLHAYNYDEAIKILETTQEVIGLAMFDHDLGDFREEDGEFIEYNGSKLASYVCEKLDKSKYPTRAISHSQSYQGALNIASKLRGVGIHTDVLMYSGKMIEDLLESLKPQ